MTRDCGQSREDSAPLDRGTGKIKEERVPVQFRYPLPTSPKVSSPLHKVPLQS
ncbi:unnamed protein product [Staurois parvus]|uniref:Uncharacterized protein n=1 Tax=Staurois parvus TaxID=386267 RepID=A0ABN9HEW5_9NEOB|nr:unnamed protein product [Staurois parvus]